MHRCDLLKLILFRRNKRVSSNDLSFEARFKQWSIGSVTNIYITFIMLSGRLLFLDLKPHILYDFYIHRKQTNLETTLDLNIKKEI